MAEFIKLTKITNWKIDSEKGKKEPTTTKTVYVRPSDIASFEEDDVATVVRFFEDGRTISCGIHVKETAEEIFKMISEEKNEQTKLNDPYKVIPYPIYYEHTPSWWDAPWWKSPTITCKTATTISEGAVCACNTSDTADLLFRVTPNYASAIIVGNGEIWE